MKATQAILVAGVLAVLAATAAACANEAGDGSAGAGVANNAKAPRTKESALKVAEAALLRIEDLPKADWGVDDNERDADDPFSAIPECEAINSIEADFLVKSDGGLASAQRAFSSQAGETLSIRSVGAAATVFASEWQAKAAQEKFVALVNPTTLQACFEKSLAGAEAAAQGIVIRRVEVGPPAVFLDGSAAMRVRLSMVALIIPMEVTFEFHMIQRGDVVAGMYTLEVNSEVVAKGQRDLLKAFESRVKAASES